MNSEQNFAEVATADTATTSTVSAQRPWWVRMLAVIGIVAVSLAVVVGALCIKVSIFRNSYFAEIPDSVVWQQSTSTQPLRSNGRGIYDANGNRVELQGVNFGNWLITEGWLSTHSTGVETDSNGVAIKINDDGVVENYLESYYQDELAILVQRFGEDKAQQLVDVYQDNFIQEIDFVNVKNIGFNCIRLPMYFGNFMQLDDNGEYVMKQDWYKRLDWFLEQCKANGLYAILDLHGVLGGQSGFEHSGTRDIDFWTNKDYQDKMAELWRNIASRYSNERVDLSQTIAAYDLVNEPVDRNAIATTRKQAEVMDVLYDAIRSVDTQNHIVSIEFCWMFGNCIDPSVFGWDNVMYQVHMYNWNSNVISYDLFYWAQDFSHSFAAYNVPYFIGEFTFFDDEAQWGKWLNEYQRRGYNWTVWNYKAISIGWWNTSWGVYVNQMNLGAGELKVDLNTATFEQIRNEWSKVGTVGAANPGNFTSQGNLYKYMTQYFDGKK